MLQPKICHNKKNLLPPSYAAETVIFTAAKHCDGSCKSYSQKCPQAVGNRVRMNITKALGNGDERLPKGSALLVKGYLCRTYSKALLLKKPFQYL